MQRVISGLGREVAQAKRIKYRCSLYSEHLLLPRDKAFCFNFFLSEMTFCRIVSIIINTCV